MASITFIPEPTGATPPDGSTVNYTPVPFEYEIDDVTQGVAGIEVSFDNVEFHSVTEGDATSVCSTFAQTGIFYLDLDHGIYTLYFRVVDQLNNVGPVTIWNLTVDIFTNITIDPVPPITNNPTLVVTGTMEAGGTVTVALNGASVSGVTYPTATTWQIVLVLAEGDNEIVATVTDTELNVASASASIVLDTVAPAVPVVTEINPAEPNYTDFSGDFVLTNEPDQTLIGLKEANTSVWLNGIEVVPFDDQDTFSFNITLAEGDNVLLLKTTDAANNESDEQEVTIVLDTVAPLNPNIVINDGIEFTLVRDVILRLTADNATQVKVSEDVNFTNVEYLPFESSLLLPFELSRGGGVKVVYAIFRDEANNETAPVFDTIILPSTTSVPIETTPDMTIEELEVTPENDYLIRLQDNRDGTFSIELYEELIDATTQTNRKGYATAVNPGEQTLSITPDPGGVDPGGEITLTLIEGAELIIYRFRTDVYNPSLEELGIPITYVVEEVNSYAAKVEAPVYEGFALGRVLNHAVDGDLKKLRISKSFELYDADTAIVQGTYYEVIDPDGETFPIHGALFDYPLASTMAEVVDLVEESDAYVITLDRDIENFDPIFGYEILFTKRTRLVTDYHIADDGRVEFLNESGIASGNVRITYTTPPTISSNPSDEFKVITSNIGSLVTLTVLPVDNKILLSDLDRVVVRFYHSAENPVSSPAYARVIVNDSYMAANANFRIVASNARAEIREFTITNEELFSGGLISATPSGSNVVVDKVQVEFTAESVTTYVDEMQVIAKSSVISSNCRILVNGEEKLFLDDPVSSKFDDYEVQVQNGVVDFLYNGECVHTEFMNLDGATISIGAGGRLEGDIVRSVFDNLTTIEYISDSPATIDLDGRAVEVEATLRGGAVLRSFEMDFESPEAKYPSRTFFSDGLVAEFLDTATVAIIGMGKREEILVVQGLGKEDEGEPADFTIGNTPDGRHFKVVSFPIIESTLEVVLTHDGVERILTSDDYQLRANVGCIVLHHPIALNDRLVVRYSSEADSNSPELFTSLDDLTERFGQPSLENTLSLGAQLAFLNGAKRVMAVQALDPSVDPGWKQAYESLERVEAYYIVPIPPNEYPLVASLGLKHVEAQSGTPRRNERVLIIGETPEISIDDISLYRESTRVTFLMPGDLSTVLNGETTQLDGRHLAAAYAGKLSSFGSVAEPGMGKRLTGFIIDTRDKYTRYQLGELTSKGATVIRREAAGGLIHRSVTTTSSTNAVDQEQSVIRIADYLAMNLRNVLESRFVGKAIIEPRTTDGITGATKRFLETQLAKRIITKFDNVTAKVDSEEPRQINVFFNVQPAFPLIEIPVAVNVVVNL